ncbi:hypothetical protein H9X86_07880 [Pseudoflavonifractor capillosus]|nr:hypothetical protein [Pseudoflavonifractor capillosus]MBM6897282.1 hypothetical protein [Pseudoflavonifractor capillosus]
MQKLCGDCFLLVSAVSSTSQGLTPVQQLFPAADRLASGGGNTAPPE